MKRENMIVRIIEDACLKIPPFRIDSLVFIGARLYRIKLWPLTNTSGIGISLALQNPLTEVQTKKGKKNAKQQKTTASD